MKISIIVLFSIFTVLPLSGNANEIDSALIHYKIGYNANKDNKQPEALRSYYRAYIAYQSNGNAVKEAQLANHIGSTFSKLRQFRNAIDYLKKALAIRKKLDLPHKIADTEFNLGVTYFEIGENLNAGNHLLNALDIYIKLEDNESIASVYHQIGQMHKSIEEYDSAILVFNRVLQYTSDTGRMARAYNQLGRVTADTIKSIAHYENAVRYAMQVFDSTTISSAYNNIAKYYQEGKSIEYYLIAERYINDQKFSNPALFNTYLRLSQLYEEKKEYVKSINYSRKYEHVSEQLRQYQEEVEQHKLFFEGQLALQEIKDFEQRQKEEREGYIYLSIGGILLLLSGVGFVLWRYQRSKRLSTLREMESVIVAD